RRLFIAIVLAATAVTANAADRDRWFDRHEARELARLTMPRVRPHLAPNLPQDGVVDTLARPVHVPKAIVGKIVVSGAASIRLRVDAPGWIAGENDSTFERFEPKATMWTPRLEASTVSISSDSDLEVSQLALGTATNSATSACMLDVACNAPV